MSEVEIQGNSQTETINYADLDQIIYQEFDGNKENLIMILQAVQNRYNYLPRSSLSYISEKLDIPLSKIYEVGTFYNTFSLEPRGRNIISMCLGTACHVRGAEGIKARIKEELKIKDGGTTEDGRYTLESVRCIGCCSLGPVIKINNDVHGRVKSDEVRTLLKQYE